MAKLTQKKVRDEKLKFLTIQQFIDKYHPGLKSMSIDYAIRKDKVDWFKPGRERFIVLTPHTLKYNPIDHPTRSRMSLDN